MSNLGDHRARLAGIIACGERLVGIGDVEQMMWNVCPLLGRGLGRTNLEMTVDRNRIATDDLTGELLRQADSERRLAGSRGSENDDQKRIRPMESLSASSCLQSARLGSSGTEAVIARPREWSCRIG